MKVLDINNKNIVKLQEIGTIMSKTPMEILETQERTSKPFCYCLKYVIASIRYNIQSSCAAVIQHPFFEAVCLIIILTNCIFIALSDPTSDTQPDWQVISDYIFQGFYSFEICLKVLALGFVFNENAYIRDPWNVFDFLIVMFGYLSYFQMSGSLNLKSLRTLRILRPLRTVSSINGLRLLMDALISSFPLLLDIFLILGFYFGILAVAGLQLWNGILKKRCVDPSTGIVDDTRVCGSHTCGDRDCVNFISNPSYGATNFDDFFSSILTAFQCVTLESWSNVEQNISDSFGPAATIYFTLHTLVGSFFLMNFMLAVIKSRVSKVYEENRELLKRGIIKKISISGDGHLNIDAKLTIMQTLRNRKSRINNTQVESKIDSILNKVEKKTFQSDENYECKENIIKRYGFYDLETETVIGLDRVIHEKELSSMDKDKKIESRNKNAFVFGNKKYSAEQRGEELTQKFETGPSIGLQFEEKKVLFNGMAGIQKIPNSELRIMFENPTETANLGEFTEEFFNRPKQECNHSPSSMMDKNHPSITKIKVEGCGIDSLSEEELQYSIEVPFGSRKKQQHTISQKITKEILPQTEVKDSLPFEVSLTNKDENKTIEEPKTNQIAVINTQAAKNNEENKDILLSDKFVINPGEIATESLFDVMPRKIVKDSPIELIQLVKLMRPPYKIRMKYSPTEWPVEVPIKEFDDEKINETMSNFMQTNSQIEGVGSSKGSEIGSKELNKTANNTTGVKKKRIATKKDPKKKAENKKKSEESESKISKKEKDAASSEKPKTVTSGEGASNAGSKVIAKTNKDEEKKEEKPLPLIEQLQKERDEFAANDKAEIPWSGQEVLVESDPNLGIWLVSNLNNIYLWQYGGKGLFTHIRHIVKNIISSVAAELTMNCLVFANTIALATDYYGQSQDATNFLNTLNIVFTSLFTVELVMKLFGFGLVKYLRDTMNCLDGTVVILSWVEIVFLSGKGVVSAFRSLRLIRTFRVIRISRLLRGLRSMQILGQVMEDTIGSFGYIGIMLLIIMIIYALFGMQLFAGKWDFPDGLPRPNYETFGNAIISMFQLLTLENWPVLLYAGMRNQYPPLAAIYFVTFLFIGNYILLNLFLAIMLDAFAEVDEEMEENPEEIEEVNEIIIYYRKRIMTYVQLLVFLSEQADLMLLVQQ